MTDRLKASLDALDQRYARFRATFGGELSGVEDDFADEIGPAVVCGSFDFGFDDADLADGEFGGGRHVGLSG